MTSAAAARDWSLPKHGATEKVLGVVYRFDRKAADKALKFIQRWCRHLEGKWAGDPLVLEPWQVWLVGSLFGWMDPEGKRRYRKCLVFIPRKNGKSTLAAAIALYLLMGDQEPGVQVYSAAGDTHQAQIVHRVAEHMAQAEPVLNKRLRYRQRRILYDALNGFYRVLSADAYTKHGLNPHGIIFDELHTQPNRDLYDVLDSATGARSQPLFLSITTAGVYDRNSICWEIYDYAKKVESGEFVDPSFLALIFEAAKEDDWTDPATWYKANPNLGVSISEDYLAAQCRYAQLVPAAENTFKRLHLNMWTEQATRWINLESWRGCLGRMSEKALEGQVCYAGLDLASTTDLCSLSLVFPREGEPWPIITRHYCPKATILKRSRRDKVPYDVWARQGWLTETPGDVTDYDFIRHDLYDLFERYQLRGLAIDRWNATQLAIQLGQEGLPVVLMGQGYADMNGPSREFERRVISAQLLHHEEDPVLTWMVGNVSRKTDPAGNIKPDKAASTERVDGVVALIMALGQAVRGEGPQASIYENQGLTIL